MLRVRVVLPASWLRLRFLSGKRMVLGLCWAPATFAAVAPVLMVVTVWDIFPRSGGSSALPLPSAGTRSAGMSTSREGFPLSEKKTLLPRSGTLS